MDSAIFFVLPEESPERDSVGCFNTHTTKHFWIAFSNTLNLILNFFGLNIFLPEPLGPAIITSFSLSIFINC